MDGWLVIARFGRDDVPLYLAGGRKAALDYALTVTLEAVYQAAVGLLGLDVEELGDLTRLDVVEFRRGVPAAMTPARAGEDLWPADAPAGGG